MRRPTDVELAQSPFDMHDLLAGEPYLLLKESHYSDTGLPLGFSFIHVNDHFVRFRLYRGRDGR